MEALGSPSDADLRESFRKFRTTGCQHQRPETSGIGTLIDGIAALYADDERRIEAGARLFDETYAALASGW